MMLETAPAETDGRLWPALTIAPCLACLADYLFWRHDPGAPWGFFFCLAAIIVLVLHARPGQRRRGGMACGLLGLAAVAAVWVCFQDKGDTLLSGDG